MPRKVRFSSIRVACASVILIIVALVSLFDGKSTSKHPPIEGPSRTALINEVRPDTNTQTPRATVDTPKTNLPPQRVGEVRNGYRLMLSGELRKVRGEIVVNAAANDPIARLFPEPSDQLIAGLLTIEPGDSLVGESEDFFADFEDQFKASLKTLIPYDKDDDQYTKELKIAVNMSRDELKAALERGENLRELMTTTREQFKELGLYRDEVNQLVEDSLKDGDFSAKDYEDLVAAANKMLDDRGIKPLELPKLFHHYAIIQGLDHPEVDENATLEENVNE